MPDQSRRLAPILLGALLLSLTGCDTVNTDPELIILTREVTTGSGGSSIRFTFDSDATPTGQAVTVRCDCTVDLGPYIQSQGFDKADVVSATVTQATLVMLFPISERLDYLNSADLRFQATGLQAATVATSSTLPTAREAVLAPVSDVNVASFVTRSSFEPVLRIDASELQAGVDYEMGIAFTIRLEIEGF